MITLSDDKRGRRTRPSTTGVPCIYVNHGLLVVRLSLRHAAQAFDWTFSLPAGTSIARATQAKEAAIKALDAGMVHTRADLSALRAAIRERISNLIAWEAAGQP